ncbi:MAG: LamG domain-containing protein, partial [Planctomycetota bacterium]
VWVNKDPNYAVDGNSMLFEYWNDKSPAYSETRRDYSPAKDWSYSGNGVTALEIDFFGDMNNGPDPPMYVKLSDGTTTAQVNHTDFNDFLEENVHTWNVPLKDFSGVTLSNITSITLGIGDKVTETGGLKEQGTVYFDDIRLQPPRCLPEYDSAADFTGDCVVDNYDLDVMATDWLLADGETLTETRDATLTDFADETSHWVTGRIDSGAIAVNEPGKITVTDPRLFGLTSMSITAWVKQTTVNEWVGIVCSRESPCGGTGEATELGIYGSEWGGPGGLGYDWSCLEDAWRHDSEFVTNVPTDGTWTFIAMSVDPTGCTLYIKADGGELQTGTRNEVEHPAQQNFAESFIIGRSSEDGGYFNGVIDDVRIYGYNLSFADINNLAYETATEPNPPPVYWYKFEEASGYTAADSGTPILVYGPVQSKANLTDPEPKLQRFVNFRDYAIFANDWLDEFKWPEP